MATTFYNNACEIDAKNDPFLNTPISKNEIDVDHDGHGSLNFYTGDGGKKMQAPHSIMNEHTAINYRTIYNGYNGYSTNPAKFTEYDDYQRCMSTADKYRSYLKDIKNPTYKNIIYHYSGENGAFDKYGLARYRMQDFVYLKYYNKIPNNYMITLRRYIQPCTDHMFGLDMTAEEVNAMNGYPVNYLALATAVTYLGEKPGNKLSEILKFDYGAKWEDKEAQVEKLQDTTGGLAGQLKNTKGLRSASKADEGYFSQTPIQLSGGAVRDYAGSAVWANAAAQLKGVNVGFGESQLRERITSQNIDEFGQKYGDQFYGDLNVVQNVKMRSRGLTFTNSFSLNFEYDLKSLKCVNPRVAMLDILTNFLILTGNYGSFWGGATVFYGNNNIAPPFGDPSLMRQGRYWDYIKSVTSDLSAGFDAMKTENGGPGLWGALGNIAGGVLGDLLGNLLGGTIGQAGQTQVPKALLSGAPSGYWHVTIGNPLDPIAMMGNMAVTKTTVQVNDVLGYDDFPTEIKFTVSLEHCQPRDNAHIESMFNAGKGRIYTFTDSVLEGSMNNINWRQNFKETSNTAQTVEVAYDDKGNPIQSSNVSGAMSAETMKLIGGNLQT